MRACGRTASASRGSSTGGGQASPFPRHVLCAYRPIISTGNNNDSIGVLALSTATAIAIVRYAIPAWRNRHYIENRWQVWTGPSRTAIESSFRHICGQSENWHKIASKVSTRDSQVPSDRWGAAISPPSGLSQDPTELLLAILDNDRAEFSYGGYAWPLGPCVYDDGLDSGTLSLLRGDHVGFRRRVSRAVNSVPLSLLASRHFTIDGYGGEGLCLAIGILGRPKGCSHGDSYTIRQTH